MRQKIILQARTSSKRLPNKVLMPLFNGLNSIELMANRLKDFRDDIVVATSLLKEDDSIVGAANALEIECFRGELENVLKRFYDCANSMGLSDDDIIIRLTADCPFIDSEVLSKAMYLFESLRVDYVSNVIERSYPKGLDVEVFSMNSLKRAYKLSKGAYGLEHVTPIMRCDALFKIASLKDNEDFSHYRLTLDTKEDLELICDIYSKIGKIDFSYKELKSFLGEYFS